MKQKSILVFILILYILLLIGVILFQVGTDFHIFVVDAVYLLIILTALWHKKLLLPLVLSYIVVHIVVDGIVLQAFPKEAMIESGIFILISSTLWFIVRDRDQKKAEEEQLQIEVMQQKSRLENTIDAMRVGTWEWDLISNKTIFNERWAEIIGYTLEEIQPTDINTWIRFTHPDDMKHSDEQLKEVFAKKRNYYDIECRMKHKDGHWVWIQDRGKVTKWSPEGKPLVISGTHLDISSRKKAEEELEYSYYLMNYIIEHEQSGIAVHDVNLNYLYVSKKYMEAYELKDKNIIGKHHYDVFPDLPQKWRDVHVRSLKGEVVKGEEDPYTREDGTVFWTRWECRPWYLRDGLIGGIIVYTEVINKEMKIKRDLQDAQQMLEDIVKSLPIGIAVNSVFPAVEFQFMNDKFAQIYRASREKLENPGSFWESVYTNSDFRDKIRKRVENDIASGRPERLVWENVPIERDGEETTYITAYATPVPNRNLLISTVVDVTEQTKRLREIEYMYTHDALTQLNNRFVFRDQLETIDDANYPLGIIIIDINGLKLINDAFGQKTGDFVIRTTADFLRSSIHTKETIYRLSGGQFAILSPNSDMARCENIKNEILQQSLAFGIKNVEISLAIGYEVCLDKTVHIQDVLKMAEDNMLKRKLIEGKSARNRAIRGILKTLTDKYTEEKVHSERVSRLCRQIGEALKLGVEEIKELELAGLLHDIGKITIPDAILNKPGKLTDFEFEKIRSHTENGYEILRAADEYSDLAEYAKSHHERWDGAGYPTGLKGENIPLFSRIICVADSYEAMTSTRPYRKAMKKEMAIEELKRCSGTQFDPNIVRVFTDFVL